MTSPLASLKPQHICLRRSQPLKLVFLPVDVVFSVSWQIIVDDKRHLLHINTSGLQNKDDQGVI